MIAKDAGKEGSGSGVSNDSIGTPQEFANEPDSANAHTEAGVHTEDRRTRKAVAQSATYNVHDWYTSERR